MNMYAAAAFFMAGANTILGVTAVIESRYGRAAVSACAAVLCFFAGIANA